VISVYVKTYSVMSDLSLCENVFCNESSFSHKLRSLITEYVFTQTQTTHYRIRFHTNSDHSLQNTSSFARKRILQWVICVCVKTYSVMGDLCLCENVFCNEWSEFVWKRTQTTHYRIRFPTNTDHSLQNTFSYKLRSLITDYVFIHIQITH
jgi:hypothetical protein